MRLTVLGTATPYPRPGNACSGYLVQSGEVGVAAKPGAAADVGAKGRAADPGGRTTVWVDAGTGTLAELQRHTALAELDAIWISHRHADHTADLLVAYYALRFAELTPAHPIPLIGPEGLLDRLAAFLGPNSVAELPRVFDFRPMSGWGEAVFGPLTLSWGPVQHGVPAFGLTVDETAAGRRLAYSGDTAPCISLEELAEGAHLLLAEVGYADASGDDPVHLTPEDAGRAAAAARVERLVLTHIDGGLTGAEAARRATAHFAGTVSVAVTGDVVEV
ncbi:MBL fold metallo-hydrolase [Herbiconiux sp. 11R-BC]|uniref:MBL fold metallo-hydrolase n=1 Tax=Herbiconiux sp. 11R-BC TaxID=3111637 RepID=UPI003C0F9C0A